MKVKVYSTITCPYCKMLKDYLTEKQIPFENVFVDQDEKGREEMMQLSGGFLGVPFTLITKDDGGQETIVGFDKNKLNQALGISG